MTDDQINASRWISSDSCPNLGFSHFLFISDLAPRAGACIVE